MLAKLFVLFSNNNDDKMTDQEVKQIAPILCGNEEGHTDENYVKMLNEIYKKKLILYFILRIIYIDSSSSSW